jgi:hypothetical protein
MNLLDAAFNLVSDYPGGAQSLAPRMGKGVSTLSHEVTAAGTAKLGLLDAEKMSVLSGDYRILTAWANNMGHMLLPLPTTAQRLDDDCMLRLADTAKEFGELCKEVAGDLADSVISDNELDRIDRETGRLIASLQALRGSLAARNLAGKPKDAA